MIKSLPEKTIATDRYHVNVFLLVSYLTTMPVSLSLAQEVTAITPSPGNASLGTIVTSPAPGKTVYNITGGSRPNDGENLFHSFSEFSIGHLDTARFLNTTPELKTSNILARVTDTNPSSLFGTIDTMSYGSANFYLMNPAGIIFGPNATLNVGGSVTFTSADYIRFTDNVLFHSRHAFGSEILSASPVAAFGFLGSNPGAITLKGSQLFVPTGKGLSLVGGNITAQSQNPMERTGQAAYLAAPDGQVHLASSKSAGEFLAGSLDQRPNIQGQSFSALGTLKIVENSVIETSGDGGGTVLIRGGHLVMDKSDILATSGGPENGKGIDIQVTNDVEIRNQSYLEAYLEKHSTGTVGRDIKIYGNTISLNAAELVVGTDGVVDAGNIDLHATNDLSIGASSLFSGSAFSGDAGNITLTSVHGAIRIVDSPSITSQTTGGAGNTGTVTVSALEGDISLVGSGLTTATRSTGAGGRLKIEAKNLELSKGSTIADDNLGPIKPGGISIELSGNLILLNSSSIAPVSRSLSMAPAADFNVTAKNILITEDSYLSSETFRAGAGGTLNVSVDTLQLTDGGQIRSGSTIQPVPPAPAKEIPSGPGGIITLKGRAGPADSILIDGPRSSISTNTEGTGAGGTINLSVRSLTIQNGGTISAKTAGITRSATGGSINITATDQVTLTGGASITARSTGPADAGTISINAGQQLDLMGTSSITTEAKQASGGNINLQAIDRIRLVDSTLSASVSDGPGGGGNISIDPKLVLFQNSTVLAQADQGAGGRIAIRADSFVADANTVVNADAGRGLNGTVTIQSPTSNLSGTVGQLVSKTSPPQVLLQNRCVALAGGREQSTFLLSGRDAVPAEPGGWLSSPISMEHWTGENTEHAAGLMVRSHRSNTSRARITPKDEPTILALRRLTPPGFLVRAFATPFTGCPS